MGESMHPFPAHDYVEHRWLWCWDADFREMARTHDLTAHDGDGDDHDDEAEQPNDFECGKSF